jgi:hypothetical protein
VTFVTDEYSRYANQEREVGRVRAFECFTPGSLPIGVEQDRSGRCSVTALRVAAQLDITPVRGYALFRRPRSFRNLFARPVWMGHWWAVTADGIVVDASWSKLGLAYVGERIALRKERSASGGFELSAHTLDGTFIEDLGVYIYAPRPVAKELERKRAEFAVLR